MNTKYPNISIPMVGEDGNAFSILGRVKRIMRRAGLPDSEWEAFHAEATSKDYDTLLMTVLSWFSVDIALTTPDGNGVRLKLNYDDSDDNVCLIHRDLSAMNDDGACAECLSDEQELQS